jgi:hypothetical protein
MAVAGYKIYLYVAPGGQRCPTRPGFKLPAPIPGSRRAGNARGRVVRPTQLQYIEGRSAPGTLSKWQMIAESREEFFTLFDFT